MVINDLITAGLNTTQAETYTLLLKHGSVSPPLLAKELHLTRSNTYKVLDQLTELGLVRREVNLKKYIYYPDNPLALTNLVAEQRNVATAREEAVKRVMNDLLSTYHKHNEQPNITVVTGHDAVVEAYHAQIHLLKPIFFLRSQSDIATIGFDDMHEIRTKPSRHNIKRHGITPDMSTTPVNPEIDTRSNLERTWIKNEDYNAPVEWSVSGSTLLIVLFGTEPHAITITNPMIAGAFLQIWKLLNNTLKAMPYYKQLPRANHKV